MTSWLRLIVAGCLAPLFALGTAQTPLAQEYPARPVTLVVPAAPGGVIDRISRLLAQRLSESWGKQFVVEHRPGANNQLAAEYVTKAQPDGYTLLFGNNGPLIYNVLLRKASPYRFSDFEPVIHVGYVSLIIVAHPKLSASNAKELVANAKANSDPIVWGSIYREGRQSC